MNVSKTYGLDVNFSDVPVVLAVKVSIIYSDIQVGVSCLCRCRLVHLMPSNVLVILEVISR